jgi:vacuole morphology and inheritance protein 14
VSRKLAKLRHAEEDGLLESLRWIVEFLDICPEEVLPFTPKILAHLLPAMASGVESIRQAAGRVNTSLMDYVVSLSDEPELVPMAPPSRIPGPDGASSARASLSSSRDLEVRSPTPAQITASNVTPVPAAQPPNPQADLDYAAAVNSLTLLFLNDHEATRVAALTWLIMLHRKAPRKVLAFNDGTFPALLKTLSDPSEAVVTRDLQLLSQISRNSEDDYFSNFMVNLLQLFSTDRKLLETRGNLIIRQLCMSLSAERIYRTLADCIEKEEDLEFASIMVQNLNNNLITAPELSELRKRLRNLETKVRLSVQILVKTLSCTGLTRTHNRTARLSLWRSSGRGATTRLLPSRCVCWLRPMSKPTICCKSCADPPSHFLRWPLQHWLTIVIALSLR